MNQSGFDNFKRVNIENALKRGKWLKCPCGNKHRNISGLCTPCMVKSLVKKLTY
jgi:hypothetical protein